LELEFRGEREAGRAYERIGGRAEPGEWIPVLLDAYGELSRILERYGARPIVAGAGAYGLHVEFDPTKDVDIVLSKPLDVANLTEVMKELVRGLKDRGRRVVGARIQLGRGGEDWVIQVFVVAGSGRVVAVEVFNLLPVRPATLYEAAKHLFNVSVKWRRGLGEWEEPLVAAGMYMVDPRPEDEVFRDMVELVGREEAERIASLVWRIVYGEGYSLEEWAGLLESLTILSPWECIWRFQELAGKGYRRRHDVEPANLRDREVLRYACKLLGTG